MLHGLRRLLAPDRIGRFGRQRAWELQLSWIRRFWPAAAFLLVAPSALAIPPAIVFLTGVTRGLVVGAAVMSGVWLAVLVTVVSSGAASQLMGIAAEGWTASDLRRLRRRGWRVTNSFKFRDWEDIDHLAVGPPGLVVVETKWSAQPWPFDGSRGFMHDQMSDAVDQTARNAAFVRSFFTRVRNDAPVMAALVLFSAQAHTDTGPNWIEIQGVNVVRGGALPQWLGTLDSHVLAPDDVERIDRAIADHVASFDTRIIEQGRPPRRNLTQILWYWAGLPVIGIATAVYAFVGLATLHRLWIVLPAEAALAVIGLVAGRIRDLRPLAWPWTTTCVAVLLALAIATVTR